MSKEGRIKLTIDLKEVKEGVEEGYGMVDRLQDYWNRNRAKILRGIRKVVASMRRVGRMVAMYLESIGVALSPLQTALVEAAFAVVSWILAIEAAISAGTLGIGAAAAIAGGAVAIALSIHAAVRAEAAIGAEREAIQRQSDFLLAGLDIFEIIWL